MALQTILDEAPGLTSVGHIRLVLFDAADEQLHSGVLYELIG